MANEHIAAEWRKIPDFPDYEASSEGEIRRTTPPRDGRSSPRPLPYVIAPKLNGPRGYLQAFLFCPAKGRRVNVTIHRLVLLAFVGECPDGHYGLHSNGDSFDNRISNLRWGEPSENNADAKRHGTTALGSRLPQSKLTPEIVADLRSRKLERGDQRRLAREFGVSASVICEALSGKMWAHVPNAPPEGEKPR